MIPPLNFAKVGLALLIVAGLWAIGPVAAANPPAISLQTISSGQLVSPVYLTNAGDGSNRLFVCDQVGQVRIIQDQMLLPTPFLDLSAKLVPLNTNYDEAGLLSIAFHPGFSNSSSPGYKKFYVFYSAASPNRCVPVGISAISTGNPCTITTTAAHGLTNTSSVHITGVTNGTFSPAINNATGTSYQVTVVDAFNFTVQVNCTSNSGLGLSNAKVSPTQPVYCRSTVSEFQVSASNANVADPLSERIVLSFDKPQDNHNGSHLEFGPDGYLYISVGDGGSQHDNDYGHTGGYTEGPAAITTGNLGNAQDTTQLLGKVLRIDPLGNNGPTGQYGIPSDNPFATTGGGVRPEIFTYGMRNPWRFSFDTDPNNNNKRIIEADVGQNDVEEINLLVSGGNYGWRIKEGTTYHDQTVLTNFPGIDPNSLIDPVAQYFHPLSTLGGTRIGSSIIGGYVYRGSAIPGLAGQYVFGDYSNSGVGTATGVLMAVDSSTWAMSLTSVIGITPGYVTSFGRDEHQELYVATKTAKGPTNSTNGQPGGIIYKIVPAQVGQMNFATMNPSQDNTIYSDFPGNSNALGDLFAGRTSSASAIRRGLLQFNVAGQVPTGATIVSSQLMLTLNMTSDTAQNSSFLYKLNDTWGQGSSGPAAGTGAGATDNDATWNDRFFHSSGATLWTTPGGDHASIPSVNNVVGFVSGNFLWSASGMNTDIQGWLNSPSTNFGWLLECNEGSNNSARRFYGMYAATGLQPTLLVTYTTSGQLTHRESWLQTYFSPVGTYVDDQADPSGDGLNNLLDYAYGYSPLVANLGYSATISNPSTAGIQTSLTTNGGNDTYTTTFLCDPRAVDLTYQLQSSTDLVNWSTIVQVVGGGTPTGSAYVSEATQMGAAPVQVVTAQETMPAPMKHFVRLLVTRTYQQ